MSQERITKADLERALESHAEALKRAGISYHGRLILEHGSKTYGRAYRIATTGVPWPCQERWHRDATTGEVYSWIHDIPGYPDNVDRDFVWDHSGCRRCNGTRIEKNSGHHRPPVGDDYLGMTKRDAFEALVTRTRHIYDIITAQSESSES